MRRISLLTAADLSDARIHDDMFVFILLDLRGTA